MTALMLSLIVFAFLAVGGVVLGYYWLLGFVALVMPQVSINKRRDPTHNFAIVIPAHNEEDGLGATLKSCNELQYPKDLYGVYVIADNCTDRTAEVARAAGVVCLERSDPELRGKGYALQWGFEHVLTDRPDAIVVIDADCLLGSAALSVFDGYLASGAEVLQASYVSSNPDESPTSYATAVGNRLENDFFYAPKSRLGLAVFLRGTGMVIRREVLAQFPWSAYSIVEDVEYTLDLLRAGHRIVFVPEVRVLSPFPADSRQLSIQRTRWASGNLSFGKEQAFGLIREASSRGDRVLADAGWTLLVLSRPLVIVEVASAFVLSVLLRWMFPGVISRMLFVASISLVMGMAAYFSLGIWKVGLNSRRLRFLLESPLIVVRLIYVSVLGVFGVKGDVWERTPR